jgi:hypothetical protein
VLVNCKWYTLSELPCWKYNSSRSVCIVRSFVFSVFVAFYAARFAAKKNKLPFLPGPGRLSVRAVKTAFCAFIGAKRRALTEGAAGQAQSFGRKGI